MSTAITRTIAACVAGMALWTPPVSGADASGIGSGDDTLTCEQIATELSPYVQQIMPNVQALAASQQQLYAQAREKGEQRKAEDALLLPLAEAGALDPTGASKRAYQMVLMAKMAKERAENDALLNSPLAKENRAQGEQLAAQAQQMKSDARLQHLLQLAQQKRCDKQ